MPDYEHFLVEDFVRDPFFQQWVIQPQTKHHHFWKSWLLKYPQKRDTVNQARDIVQTLGFRAEIADNADFITVWEAVHENMNTDSQPTTSHSAGSSPAHSKNWKIPAAAIAASIAAIALLAFIYLNLDIPFAENVYQTDFGQTQEIILPDGSQVTLNANSTLSYDGQWKNEENAAASRAVWLEGEAYFQVTKQHSSDQQPVKFTVHTQDLTISVLGTEFNVNQRDAAVKVVLTEGQVQLQNSSKTVDLTMTPGELVEYSAHTQQALQTKVNSTVYTAWKENRYVFENVALEEIVQLIEHNYGKQVIIKTNELKQRKITATIPTTELSILLTILKETLDIEITHSENQIILHDS